MVMPNEQIVYSLNVEDIRRVATGEGLRELSDAEILKIEEKLGDALPWYELVLSAIHEAVPGLIGDNEDDA